MALKKLPLSSCCNAALWVESLTDKTKNEYDKLTVAFERRCESSEMLKYKSAKEIFMRRQRPTEIVDDYYSHFCRLVRQRLPRTESKTIYLSSSSVSDIISFANFLCTMRVIEVRPSSTSPKYHNNKMKCWLQRTSCLLMPSL